MRGARWLGAGVSRSGRVMKASAGGLAELLTEHPFSDGADLISTVDRSVTAGAARC